MHGLDFYLTAYQELQYDRPLGMGAGPIPWSSIVKYARIYSLSLDEFEILQNHIRVLETASNRYDEEKEKRAGAR